jgi:site-specific DNA recombinase
VERFADQGISGAAIGNRPGLLKMQESALAKRFDVLIVTDLSRLSRSQGDLSKLIDRFVARDIRVIGVQDGYDSARKGHKMQAGLSGIIGEAFREMISDRTYSALESRAKQQRPTGGAAYGYIAARDSASGQVQIEPAEARVVAEIFEHFADGRSCRAIAAKLNGRGVPSPGSSWKRVSRRANGWMGSGVRVIVRNERYVGQVHWNVSQWRKDPDTGKRQRVMRPRSEWITHLDATLRIVSDDLWQRAQLRFEPANGDQRFKSGGKPKHLLSGLLHCNVCGSRYTITDQRSYGCFSYHDGKACSNSVRVRKDHIEDVLLRGEETGLAALLAPARVERMAKEMQSYHAERVREMQRATAEAPRELQELTVRIARLRGRLCHGDSDMQPDELQAAIDRAEAKRKELESRQPAAKASAKALSILPRAAELYRRQIAQGLDGDPRAALKARVFLREWFGGKIRLDPLPDGGLMAHWHENAAALLRTAALGTFDSGGRI